MSAKPFVIPLEWLRDVAKALDAKPWLQEDRQSNGSVAFQCLFCNGYSPWNHASDCRMRTLEDLSRTIPKELLE